MPWRRSRSSTCSMTGLLTMGTIGLGRLIVRGRRREPSPPAITTAFIGDLGAPWVAPGALSVTAVYSVRDLHSAGGRPLRGRSVGTGAHLAGSSVLGVGRPRRDRDELPGYRSAASTGCRPDGRGEGERLRPRHRRRRRGGAGRRRSEE